MKKITTLIISLFIILPKLAGQEATLKPYGIKSAIIEYSYSGDKVGKGTLYFDDYGSKSAMLTDAVEDIPGEIIKRKKMGFTFPVDEWLRTGKLGKMVMENILDVNPFNRKFIEKMIDNFKAGKTHWSRLWALYVLNSFH